MRKNIPQALYRSLVIEARGLCSLCHELPIQQIHHIIRVSEGGANEYENLIPICATCHSKIHRLGIEKSRLFKEKALWAKHNEEILSQIIKQHTNLTETMHALTRSFSTLTIGTEYDFFQERLNKLLSDSVVFQNFARIKTHKIKKVVTKKADCWTDENMQISPIVKMNCRTMHIRGDGITSAKQIEFSANAAINKKPIDCNVLLTRDDPTFKSFKISFGNMIMENQTLDLSFRYYWCNTWNFLSDYYSYDVLSWVDSLSYDFFLPNQYKIINVEGFLIDLFGHEWKDFGYCTWDKSRFQWKIKKPPIFCSAVVRYNAVEQNIADS